MEPKKKKLRCPACKGRQCYKRVKTGDIVCRDCGAVTLLRQKAAA